MARIVWIVVLFLLLPAGFYLLLNGALSSQEDIWAAVALKKVPLEVRPQLVLSRVCYNPVITRRSNLSAICGPYKNTRHLRAIALGAAVTPVLYSLLLIGLSYYCRTKRALLLKVFRPAIYLSTFLVAALILVQWLLISGSMYGYGFGRLNNDNYFWMILLGVVALVGAFFTVKPLLAGVPRARTEVLGLQLNESEYPRIWNFVRELAVQAEAMPPDHIVVGFTPTFFVTEATVDCISGMLDGATLYLSLPLCRIFTVKELAAVVLHELSHFKGEDATFSIRFYPIYRGVQDAVSGVANASAQVRKIGLAIPFVPFKVMFVLASLTLLPSVYLLRFFLECFSYAERHIGRERELSADTLAARIQGTDVMASALVKLAAFSIVWAHLLHWVRVADVEGVVKAGEASYDPGQFFGNMSQVFCGMVQSCALPDRLQNLDEKKMPHPTDTHPPLSVRLNALQTTIASVRESALSVQIDEPGSSVIDNVEALETDLSGYRHMLMSA